MIRLLKDKSININYQSLEHQYTALLIACDVGNLRVVNILIEKGADVNLCRTYGWSALQIAAMEGHLECVKTLIKAGANLNH